MIRAYNELYLPTVMKNLAAMTELARAQWELRKPFAAILSVMPLSALLALYYPYHEADESKTVAVIRARLAHFVVGHILHAGQGGTCRALVRNRN